MSGLVASEPGWIFSRRVDLAVFGGSAACALGLCALGAPLGLWDRPVPLPAWLAFVLLVDVAHVWSTLFRVYLDPVERRRRPGLYGLAPLVAYALGALVYGRFGHGGFWRAMAYLAVWHFVRQQVGWVSLYHRRRGESGTWDAALDRAAVYTAAGWPLLWWHATLPRGFDWFVSGDFWGPWPSLAIARGLEWVHLALLCAWGLRQWTRSRGANPGVVLVVTTTWACWYAGIVLTDNDWAFTVTNVLIHGVPYLALLWRYARGRYGLEEASSPGEAPREPLFARRVVLAGVWAFCALLGALAFGEELAWDQLAWHERARVFGDLGLRPGPSWLRWIVPLLAVPQVTHYVLDGFVWRGGPANPGLSSRLGFDAGRAGV